MIGTPEVLKGSQGKPMPPQLQAFGINPARGAGLCIDCSHPPLDARIEALRSPHS